MLSVCVDQRRIPLATSSMLRPLNSSWQMLSVVEDVRNCFYMVLRISSYYRQYAPIENHRIGDDGKELNLCMHIRL